MVWIFMVRRSDQGEQEPLLTGSRSRLALVRPGFLWHFETRTGLPSLLGRGTAQGLWDIQDAGVWIVWYGFVWCDGLDRGSSHNSS